MSLKSHLLLEAAKALKMTDLHKSATRKAAAHTTMTRGEPFFFDCFWRVFVTSGNADPRKLARVLRPSKGTAEVSAM